MVCNDNIDWKNVIKKVARGIGDANLGEVHKIRRNNAIKKSGMVNKEVYDIPRSFVEKFDHHRLLLRITKKEYESLQDQGIMT
ncbi:MAG TPA: hypothetical protein VD815_03325 [Candidatus Saccharimonadales bacterium]|nr:hypothetical protein [Candidatus Saccharimonadales bacterium]